MGELVWRHAHPVRAGRSCTTHVIVREQGSRVTVAVRVAPDEHERSGRAAADIPHLRPAFLRTLARTTRLTCDGSLTGAAFVEEHEVDPTLVDFLLSETRQLPVVVLAPLESGGYLIEPEALADELLGIAHLRVLATHPCTFRLTDALGDRRLSAYWGAMRAYLPRFSCADDARRHPLLRRDEVTDPVLRAFLIGRLAAEGAAATRWPSGITRREIPDAKAVAAPPPAEAQPPSAPAVVLDGPTAAVPVDLTEVLGQLSSLVAVHQRIADELEQMRATLAVRSAGTAALDRRLASLERLLAAHLAPPPSAEVAEPTVAAPDEREPAESPAALQDVVRQSGEQDADALVFLEEAERSALDSPYEDPERVRAILDAMALVARRRQEGKLGRSLKDSFRELGVEYRGGIAEGTSQGLREQYRFRGPRGEEIRCATCSPAPRRQRPTDREIRRVDDLTLRRAVQRHAHRTLGIGRRIAEGEQGARGIGTGARGGARASRRWRGSVSGPLQLVPQFEHQAFGELLPDARHLCQGREVAVAHRAHEAVAGERGEQVHRQRGTHAGGAHQALEEPTLVGGEEAVQRPRVLAHDHRRVQRRSRPPPAGATRGPRAAPGSRSRACGRHHLDAVERVGHECAEYVRSSAARGRCEDRESGDPAPSVRARARAGRASRR
jgi:hypothetical protein